MGVVVQATAPGTVTVNELRLVTPIKPPPTFSVFDVVTNGELTGRRTGHLEDAPVSLTLVPDPFHDLPASITVRTGTPSGPVWAVTNYDYNPGTGEIEFNMPADNVYIFAVCPIQTGQLTLTVGEQMRTKGTDTTARIPVSVSGVNENLFTDISDFEFLLEYDRSVMTFTGAVPGGAIPGWIIVDKKAVCDECWQGGDEEDCVFYPNFCDMPVDNCPPSCELTTCNTQANPFCNSIGVFMGESITEHLCDECKADEDCEELEDCKGRIVIGGMSGIRDNITQDGTIAYLYFDLDSDELDYDTEYPITIITDEPSTPEPQKKLQFTRINDSGGIVLIDVETVDGAVITRALGFVPETPGAPNLVSATTLVNETVTLLWEAPSDDGGSPITGYEYRTKLTSASVWGDEVVIPNSANLITVAVEGLPLHVSHDFQVRAVNAQGEGEWSGIEAATPYRQTVPMTLTVGSGGAKEDEDVTITITTSSLGSITDGINNFTFDITYDHTRLQFVGGVRGAAVPAASAAGFDASIYSPGVIRVTWDGEDHNMANHGVIAELTFTVRCDDTSEKIALGVAAAGLRFRNEFGTAFGVTPVPGEVTVLPETGGILWGDADLSGEVDMWDAVAILLWVNSGGTVQSIACMISARVTEPDGDPEMWDAIAILLFANGGGDPLVGLPNPRT
jgi:hypothetical protein